MNEGTQVLGLSGQLATFFQAAKEAGCPADQGVNFARAGIMLQPRQLAGSAAARACDLPDGPTAVGYGGARGGGKSYWLLAQVGADDCQRAPGLKCLLLRKVGKANMEHFEDLRRRLFAHLPHEFSAHRGILTFANGSRIIAGHFQNEKDIDAYLGLEYDVIAVEEATTLSARKYQDISTCCRSSKTWIPSTGSSAPPLLSREAPRQLSTLNSQPSTVLWRPRIYSTTNPGGIGHAWYKARFVTPHLEMREGDTRFIASRVGDNSFNNPEYRRVLEGLTGWQKRAWLEGDWDIAAGQFFTTFRRDVHVVDDFDEGRAVEWWAALDYGFTHYTVVLLGCTDCDGNTFVVDEHAERLWIPQRHALAIKAMLARHCVPVESGELRVESSSGACGTKGDYGAAKTVESSLLIRLRQGYDGQGAESPNADYMTTRLPDNAPCSNTGQRTRPLRVTDLRRFVAGADVFSRQSDGVTIAQLYAREGIRLTPANMDRLNGWAEVLQRFGDAEAGVAPRLFIHRRCARLVETLPVLQHDPNRPEDVLKVDADEEGNGGDDAADALRYLVATKARTIRVEKLRGL